MIANRSRRLFAALFIVLAINLSSFASQQSVAAPIAILGIPEETEALLAQLTNPREVKILDLTFIVGELRGKSVVLARVGFGKVNAAMAATLLIEYFKPEGLIFTGAAGALNPELIPGDVVIGTNTTEHDFGMLTDKSTDAPTGFTHWRTRNPINNEKNPRFFTADSRLLLAARKAGKVIKLERVVADTEVRDPEVKGGVIVTGDLFVSEKSKNYELHTYFDADAVEMEGGAVAQVCWQFGVPCLIIRSISDTASGSSLIDYYKFVKIAARNSSALVTETIAELIKLGPAPPKPSGTATWQWKLAFELAFGQDTPYSSKFPDLYKLPYDINLKITREVLDQIVEVMLKETKAKRVKLTYSPGGFKDFPVVPSAQLEIEATDATAEDAMNILGYLAQQTTVIASKRMNPGNRPALQIVQTSGRNLAAPKFVEDFWHRLGESAPKLQPGFSSIEVGGKPGIYIIDSDGDWLARDLETRFNLIIDRVSREFSISTVTNIFNVDYVERSNNWKLDSNGEQYLRRFDEKGMSALRQRLVNEYQPKVEEWMREAFEKYAPEAIRKKQMQDKGVEPVTSPRLNAVPVPARNVNRPEYMQTP